MRDHARADDLHVQKMTHVHKRVAAAPKEGPCQIEGPCHINKDTPFQNEGPPALPHLELGEKRVAAAGLLVHLEGWVGGADKKKGQKGANTT